MQRSLVLSLVLSQSAALRDFRNSKNKYHIKFTLAGQMGGKKIVLRISTNSLK